MRTNNIADMYYDQKTKSMVMVKIIRQKNLPAKRKIRISIKKLKEYNHAINELKKSDKGVLITSNGKKYFTIKKTSMIDLLALKHFRPTTHPYLESVHKHHLGIKFLGDAFQGGHNRMYCDAAYTYPTMLLEMLKCVRCHTQTLTFDMEKIRNTHHFLTHQEKRD